MARNILFICAGASVGATLRWLLGLACNGLVPLIPMGTLIANLAGGYLIGIMLAAAVFFPQIPDGVRLFVITGFLGALTTFSTFSGEIALLLQQRHFVAAMTAVFLHVAGSLAMTALGMGTVAFFARP